MASRCSQNIDLSPFLENHSWSFPVPIEYGLGRIEEIGNFCLAKNCSRPLVVTDRGSVELPYVNKLLDSLAKAGLSSELFSNVSPNPRDIEIESGRSLFLSGEHDAVIAIGGGSGLDAGKAIGLTVNNSYNLWDFEYERTSPPLVESDFPILICIPTTAGTGAETESTAMLTDTVDQVKRCIWHPNFKPALALLDPELTINLPSHLTAWTGVDALTHAIEAYSVPDLHPLCDSIALQGMELVHYCLPKVYSDPNNISARGGMLVGSCLSGIAFLKGLGLAHAISHMIGALYDTHHGLTNAVLLSSVVRFNASVLERKIPKMASAIGLKDHSPERFFTQLENLMIELEIPRDLLDIGVPRGCAKKVAELAIRDSAASTNPREVTVPQIAALVNSLL